MTKKTPDYREILRLYSENEYSQQEIADSVGSSKRTVNKTLKLAQEHHIHCLQAKQMANWQNYSLLHLRRPSQIGRYRILTLYTSNSCETVSTRSFFGQSMLSIVGSEVRFH